MTLPVTAVASYSIGRPRRPPIVHDNGFLRLGRRAPTSDDYLALAKWKLMLEGAEALRPDLTDALAAYRHFLEGGGKPRVFSYERYVMNDESGRTTLRNAILDIQHGVCEIDRTQSPPLQFSVTGTEISCGSSTAFPYPATENWQKAIGGHSIWLSGEVRVHRVSGRPPEFSLGMTLHVEDRYNFNPGQADIATGIPDNENGIFEMTGLAHQFDHTSTLTRSLRWVGYVPGVTASRRTDSRRVRQPADNRRLRNRL